MFAAAAAAVEFLGHRVDQDGVRLPQRHVQAISDPPPPSGCETITAVFRYGEFLQEIPSRYRPYAAAAHRYAQGAPKTLEWPPAAAFGAAKAALAAAVPLAHPAANAVLSLATDASDTHVGGVLQQLNGGRWQPLAFYSKKLSGASTRDSTFDRELLAAFRAVRHFRFLLEGRQFCLLTHHKPLVTSLFRTTPPWSARQQRQLSFIAEFTSDIRHTPGQENVVRDALSCPPSATTQPLPPSQRPSPALTAEDWPEEGLATPERHILAAIADAQPVDFSAMASAQQACLELAEMMNSTKLQITTQVVGYEMLLRDVLTGVFRPLVPIQHREAVFQSLHAIHHPGVRATRRLIAARFCWPQMAKAITQMARACLHCQRGKVHRHVHLQPAEIPVPHRHFAHLPVDLVGPLPPLRGHTYLFTIIDRTSRWPEAIPLASITVADCARNLFAGWVSGLGVPATITSDRGAQFTSALWAGLCSLLNIQHSPTTAKHPQSNGLVEHFPGRHRRLARPPPLGATGYQDHFPRGLRIFAGGGSVWLAAGTTWTVHQHRRVAVTVLPQGAANHDDQPPATAGTTQRCPGSIRTT